MDRPRSSALAFWTTVCLTVQLPTTHAAIIISGDVDPPEGGWKYNTHGFIGKTADGVLEINGGSQLSAYYGYIGLEDTAVGQVTVTGTDSMWNNRYSLIVGAGGNGTLDISDGAVVNNGSVGYIGQHAGSTGAVRVDGADSIWNCRSSLNVGDSGSGTLYISGESTVSVQGGTNVAYGADSTGSINFGAGGGMLATQALLASPSQLSGTGTITTHGLVSDVDLVFDSATALRQTLTLDSQPGQLVTMDLDLASDPDNNGDLGAGWRGSGSLTICDGTRVQSRLGYIGRHRDATGVVSVDGTGSEWINDVALHVGDYGSGTLNISGGGAVSVDGQTLAAHEAGSTGLIRFGTGGGTLTTESLSASPAQLMGTGTINARGLQSDIDLVFDSEASLTQTVVFDSLPDQNVTVNLDMASDPWSNGALGAGWNDYGSLTIRNGITVRSESGCVGSNSGAVGIAAVDGENSTWRTGAVFVGQHGGNGTLSITAGAVLNTRSGGLVGWYAGSTGVVTVDGEGSTWESKTSLYIGNKGGTGTVNITTGANVDCDSKVYIGNLSGTGGITVDGERSALQVRRDMRVGASGGSGELIITNGGYVHNGYGHVGIYAGSTGVVIVDGAGSTWSNGNGYNPLSVGNGGNGRLSITGGGTVLSEYGYIGAGVGSPGLVAVDGTGSTWENRRRLNIRDNGTLHVTGGGTVTALELTIDANALLAVDVANGSLLQRDSSSLVITNNGIVRILAGARAKEGRVYSPIDAAAFSGSGIYQAVGGTWDPTSHRFTASNVELGTSGSTLSIDRSQTQRVLFVDSENAWSLGASLLDAQQSAEVDFTATAIGGSALDNLQSLLGTGESVLGGWVFALDGAYAEGDPVYLSFSVGSGHDRSDFDLWHFDGVQWAEFDAVDLTCNGQYASFTVDGFSGYAVSVVPEPGSLLLLVVAALVLLVQVQWKRKG